MSDFFLELYSEEIPHNLQINAREQLDKLIKNELSRQNDVPHPPVEDSLERLNNPIRKELEIYFIHLNHSNPLLIPESNENKILFDSGCKIPTEGQEFLI